MRANNVVMKQAGYAPAAEVARELGKALSTIHRLVSSAKLESQRDGKALYVDLRDLAAYYEREGNEELAKKTLAMRDRYAKEHGVAPAKALASAS